MEGSLEFSRSFLNEIKKSLLNFDKKHFKQSHFNGLRHIRDTIELLKKPQNENKKKIPNKIGPLPSPFDKNDFKFEQNRYFF